MKLITDNGELTLPADFSFEVEQNSAFFSEDGAASIAATIPATVSDQAKLEFPNRIARSKKFVNSIPASIQKGVFQKKGMLVIATADKDSITASMALEDSELYNKHKDKNLKDIFSARVLRTYSTPTAWYNWLFNIYKGSVTYNDFRIVPVAVNYDEDNNNYQINNAPNKLATQESGFWPLFYAARYIYEGDDRVSVPDGYGITPFLTLGAFFRILFELLGYTVVQNCFATHSTLQNLILLHNCSDTICNSKIDFSDLVPNCSVSDIIDWMKQKFHAQIAVKPESNVVDIHLMETILAGSSDHDLTSEIIGSPSFAYKNSSRVIITPNTSLDGAAPAEETLSALISKYGGYNKASEASFPTVPAGIIVQRLATGDFYEVKSSGKTRIGSNYFKYDRANSESSEEFSPDDLMAPMVFVNGCLMPFIGERKHRNTTYKDSDKDKDQEILIADYAGTATSGGYRYATTQKYDDTGVLRVGKQGLNAEDWYFLFFKKYGDILLNNCIEVSGEFNLTIEDIFKYNLYNLKQFNGQMLLPTFFKYEVGRRIKCLEAKFYLVKTFDDGGSDQPIPDPAPAYYWVFNNSEIDEIDAREAPYGCDYVREWNAQDQYQVERPEFQLPTPTAAGQESYHVTRYIDIYLEDHRVGDQRTYQGMETADQWYDSQAL